MSPSNRPTLCVAIHDVAPATWPECLHLLHAVRAVADIPLTWLVVPRYHGSRFRSRNCEAMLDKLLGEGHELALHGYTHRDEEPLDAVSWVLRAVYTQREGEFAALSAAEARRRIDLGLAWFGERGWPVKGFVAPAWLVGKQVWDVLAEYPLLYTTTYGRFHLLGEGVAVRAPALVYAARNRAGRWLSPRAIDAIAAVAGPLVRVALHPRDAHYPELVLHAQRLIERLMVERDVLTKVEFARRMGGGNTRTTRPDYLGAPR